MLDDRKLKVLEAIIENYTLTAQPVGSKTILQTHDLGVSSATIRNDMGALEDLGLIEKTHSSSGRIPSKEAYRYYVQRILDTYPEDYGHIKPMVVASEEFDEIENLVDKSTKILSQATKQAALALINYNSDALVKGVNLTRIDKNHLVLVLVFGKRDIVHESFYIEGLDDKDHEVVNRLLNENLGVSLSSYIAYISKYAERPGPYERIFGQIVQSLIKLFKDRRKTEVIYNGLFNIFKNPEYQDGARAQDFIDLVEDKEVMEEILARDLDKEISVSIGLSGLRGLEDISIITTSFGYKGNSGTVGIIGPTRMNYDRVIFSVMSIASRLRAVES